MISIDRVDIFDGFHAGGNAPMQRDVLTIDNRCERQLLKRFNDRLVRLLIKLVDHLLSEVVICRALSGLVVAS